MYTIAQLAEAFDVPHDTATGWAKIGHIGTKRGHARLYNEHEAFAIGLLAGIRHAGYPVGYGVIDAALAVAASRERPDEFVIAESETARFTMSIPTATAIIAEKLKDIDIEHS